MTEEIDTILDQTLAKIGHDFIDGGVIESSQAFEQFMVQLVQIALPAHEISLPKSGTILGKGTWSFTVDVEETFERMKPFAPGQNRDEVTKFLKRLIVRRDTWNEVDTTNLQERLDWSKLTLIPKMGSVMREGPTAGQFLGASEAEKAMLSRPAYGYVHAVPVINHPSHFLYLPKLTLPGTGMTEDDVFKKALQNIKSKADDITVEFENDEIAFIGKEYMDGVVSQLILYPDFWKSLSEKVEDDLFIHVVQHDQIIVCKSRARDLIFRIVSGAATGKIDSLLPATFFTHDAEGFRIFAKMLPDDA